uniref:EH domain-containing protein n=1 Tax=Romanomermis culicivorax TaxID=13658 RepID=A0A915IEF2_ROMCU
MTGVQSKESSRGYGHIADILLRKSDRQETLPLDDPRSEKLYDDLQTIYERKIRPLELATKFSDLKIDSITGDEIRSKPVVLLVGPWSTGKTTFLKYLLDISDQIDRLDT